MDQFIVESGDIEQGARLVMHGEAVPGEHFKKLVNGADAAGQGDEGVGKLRHEFLALRHCFDHFHALRARVGQLTPLQIPGDDSDHFASGVQAGIGHHAHESETSPTGDEADAAFRQSLAERQRRLRKGRIRAARGSTEDADGANRRGFFHAANKSALALPRKWFLRRVRTTQKVCFRLARPSSFDVNCRMIARQYLFTGRVQGVGFRYAAKQVAKGFDVVGWVRNLADGRVELQVMGDESELEDFVEEIYASPLGHHILEREERAVPPLTDIRGFNIIS